MCVEFQIAYSQDLNRISKVQASLRRAGVTDEDGDEALNTDITASYSRQISDVSSIRANIRYRESEVQSGDSEPGRIPPMSLKCAQDCANADSLPSAKTGVTNT